MKHLQYFEDYSGRIYNPENPDKRTDGPSATEVPTPYHIIVDEPLKIQRGSSVKRKQKLREKNRKEMSKEFRISKLMQYQTTDDIIQFSPYIKRVDSNAGGATNI